MFFQLRVVALIRGILISLDADVHARMVWRPYAMAALRAAGERIPAWALEQEQEIESGGTSTETPRTTELRWNKRNKRLGARPTCTHA